ncbi:hypothetical protein TEA_013596 [Camellia sinensis var. sinensis]|uniref:Uncharacterized protein n=1 Tax=Camellia sinensis var. sinensis TaxID=542762 RepID=A0A4V3WR27_CAMSN|nr:hypothetical protein TEA_013596 [Camellia sinensis var. sinensis]
MVPHVAHTIDQSGEYGVNVARTVFRISTAASRTMTSNFAKASYAIGLAYSEAAILLADTHWKEATPILAKAGIVACAVGLLADMWKDLPMPLFTEAMAATIFITIPAMVFAKHPPALGDVPSSVVPRVAHTTHQSGEYGVNVARTVFRVSTVASRIATSNFAKASYAIGLAHSGAAILLADTHWKAATPILAKAGIVACAVELLADMGKDLPLPFSATGRVNDNGDPPALGDVPISVVPRVAHTADRSGEYGVNVGRAVISVSVAASRTTTSNFAKASYAIGLADSGATIFLADTHWKAATPFWQRLALLLVQCVNNNGDPPALGDAPSSVIPRIAHTTDRSGEYGVNVARTVFRVSAAASRTTTSNFAKASYAIGLADSGAAILLADTH